MTKDLHPDVARQKQDYWLDARERIMGACQSCKALDVKVEIRAPGELKQVLARSRELVASGVLTVLPEESPWSMPFDEVDISGPWEDIVSYVFRCNACGKKFGLSVETYHGTGGEWKLIL